MPGCRGSPPLAPSECRRAAPTTRPTRRAAARCEVARAAGRERGAGWLRVAGTRGTPPPSRTARRTPGSVAPRPSCATATASSPPPCSRTRTGHRRAGSAATHLATLAVDVARRGRLRSPAPDATDPDNPFHLAPQAGEIALVAEGLSDREIGTRLFISHRTVERHVSSLLTTSTPPAGTASAAVAHRHDLVTPSAGLSLEKPVPPPVEEVALATVSKPGEGRQGDDVRRPSLLVEVRGRLRPTWANPRTNAGRRPTSAELVEASRGRLSVPDFLGYVVARRGGRRTTSACFPARGLLGSTAVVTVERISQRSCPHPCENKGFSGS